MSDKTKPKTFITEGYGDEYIVLNMKTGKPETNVLLLFYEYHRDLIPILKQLGMHALAKQEENKWDELDKCKGNNND
uniref:Uncharacterized protein n=1 Tax=viral metagenome TaxID=1070528 RepID=A0A6M3LSZ8_9ZZZZ